MSKKRKLDGRYLVFDPGLARRFGTNGALLLSLVSFRALMGTPDDDGRAWARLPHAEIRERWIPGISDSTIQRTIGMLCDEGVLLRGTAKPGAWNRTLSYSIDLDALASAAPDAILAGGRLPSVQDDVIDAVDPTASSSHSERFEPVVSNACISKRISNSRFKEEKERLAFFEKGRR